MKQLCTAKQIPAPDDLSLKQSGNANTVLLHWSFLVMLVSMLETNQQLSLRQQFELSAEEKDSLPQPQGGFDSYCHLDRLMRVCSLRPSLRAKLWCSSNQEWFEVQLTGSAGVFCYQDTNPSPSELTTWDEQGVAPVIGVHPRHTVNDRVMLCLGDLLDRPEVVGLG